MSFEDWKISLIEFCSQATGIPMDEMRLDDQQAKLLYEQGLSIEEAFINNFDQPFTI